MHFWLTSKDIWSTCAILCCLVKMFPFYHPLRISKWHKPRATCSLSHSQTWRRMTERLWIHLSLLEPLSGNIIVFQLKRVQQTNLQLYLQNVLSNLKRMCRFNFKVQSTGARRTCSSGKNWIFGASGMLFQALWCCHHSFHVPIIIDKAWEKADIASFLKAV